MSQEINQQVNAVLNNYNVKKNCARPCCGIQKKDKTLSLTLGSLQSSCRDKWCNQAIKQE